MFLNSISTECVRIGVHPTACTIHAEEICTPTCLNIREPVSAFLFGFSWERQHSLHVRAEFDALVLRSTEFPLMLGTCDRPSPQRTTQNTTWSKNNRFPSNEERARHKKHCRAPHTGFWEALHRCNPSVSLSHDIASAIDIRYTYTLHAYRKK